MDQEGKEEYIEFLNLIKIFISMLSENGKLISARRNVQNGIIARARDSVIEMPPLGYKVKSK